MRIHSFWFFLMLVAACSGTSTGTSSAGADGSACADAGTCAGGICVSSQDFPGGYCTKACTLADASSCPGGSICIDDVSGVPPGTGATAICYESCQTDADCGRTGYKCLEKANHMVCRNGA